MTQVHVVYAHPSEQGFTRELLDAFLAGLDRYTLTDLYASGFRPELTRAEYERESGYRADAPIAADVAAEHARLDAADVWAFVYPVWWADCPALLKGWFDRVWTVGYAYKPATLRPARRALVLCTAGYPESELDDSGCLAAMRTVMLADRVGARAHRAEFHVFGGAVLRASTDPDDAGRWGELKARHLTRVGELARSC